MHYLCDMVLSILISVYNFDCRSLIQKLLPLLPDHCEIVVADDASSDLQTKECNRALLERCKNVRYWESANNLGRARIRNKLAQLAQGDWLLFLDCDAMPWRETFITDYLSEKDNADVICGGTKGMGQCPGNDVSLRFKYEKSYWEKHSAETRNRNPYDCFTPFNFMIRKGTFEEVMFDEGCLEYGHEDTLFGEALKRKGIRIKHIENPAIHTGLDTNKEFLRKTETALKSLLRVDPELKFNNRLTQTYLKLKRWHLIPLVLLWHAVAAKCEQKNLIGNNPSLLVFQLYKLGRFCKLCRKKKK